MKPVILVVEDEPLTLRLLTVLFGQSFRVRSATNGEEALQAISEEIPSLIISDIMMPKMDGFELLLTLRKDPRYQRIRFVFVTAKADPMSRQRGMDLGADDYIAKPIEVGYLKQRLTALLLSNRPEETGA